ncbi:uncharacterized protein MONBRDRAFT_33582 [Monosiga brevicollis MX1]|uniref:phosphatidate phosphatase n=1 Tax=Monosiga brevicollis TaxID=81824 RepID=A9V682_MONBE|nr:uncharacterized protein MONBRDRAFT_33582 [Monosiga brevicollis MX1]EDQ86943.1 predicted protein [Monosiga brevicollis MX1]|eukprot:XP_001748182.1 hypothetical protein [Monosiga brevicollis MX1]
MELFRRLSTLYNDINPATLSGAVDVIVVQQPDGSLKCSPFHVRFGKLTLLRAMERQVRVVVNGEQAEVAMRVGRAGEAYFVHDINDAPENALPVTESNLTSPVTTPLPRLSDVESSGNAADADRLSIPASISEEPAEEVARSNGLDESHASHFDDSIESWLWGDMPVRSHEHSLKRSNSQQFSRTVVPSPRDPTETELLASDAPAPGPLRAARSLDDITLDSSAADVFSLGPTGRIRSISESVTSKLLDHSPVVVPASSCDAADDSRTPSGSPGLIARNARGLPDEEITNEPGTPTPASLNSIPEPESEDELGDNGFPVVELSLCGGDKDKSQEELAVSFNRHHVDFSQFVSDPTLLQHKDLVVRIGGERYFSWEMAGPYIMSHVVFHQPLPAEAIAALEREKSRRETKSRSWLFGWASKAASSNASVMASDESDVEADDAEHTTASEPSGSEHNSPQQQRRTLKHRASMPVNMPSGSSRDSANEASDDTVHASSAPADSRAEAAARPRPATAGDVPASASGARVSAGRAALASQSSLESVGDMARKSLRLTSEQLLSLNLKPGSNVCEFTVVSKLQGKATISCRIFLWHYTSKIVVSDIDGTITRSDMLGHAAAFMGTDWTQTGIATLYSGVSRNGYNFLYLSSRSISQSMGTREYLRNIIQDTHKLPDGPILLSPSSLFKSLHREVILRRPEEFKITCLSDIQNLFPPCNPNPFVAGFGNRHSDVVTYRAVGITDSRIFTVDPAGLLKVSSGTYMRSSYSQMSLVADAFFPPINGLATWSRGDTHSDYDNFNYWRAPIMGDATNGQDSLLSSLSEEEAALLGLK